VRGHAAWFAYFALARYWTELGAAGVTASALMLARIYRASRRERPARAPAPV
jgi:hypothetical protein